MGVAESLSELSNAQKAESIRKLIEMLGNGSTAPKQPIAPSQEKTSQFLRDVLRQTYAQDARGEAMRAGWRTVGQGLSQVLRAMAQDAEHAPTR